jgi:hypothetical protein
VQGESFPSWVDRMAVRMRTGPGWVIRELGVELLPGGKSVVQAANYGISMSVEELDAVHAATGVVPDAVKAMLLSVYDGTVLDLSSLGHGPAGGGVGKREWGLFRGSRCCPDCVTAGGGIWRLWWRLGGAAACPDHRVLLHGECPRCRLPLRWSNYRFPIRAPYPAEWATACMNWDAGRRRVCGLPLAELPLRPASAEMLEVQDLYLRAAEGQPLHLAGKGVTPAAWFAEMSQMVGLARLAGPREFPGLDAMSGASADVWREDHIAGDGQRSWTWRSCPPSPELAAALLHVLSPVFRAASEPEFRDAASWLIAAAYRRQTRYFRPVTPAALPPFTRRAFMSSEHRGDPRVFLGKFLYPEPQLARQGVTPAHIPSYLNRDDVLEQVTPHLAPKRGATPGSWLQRRFAALCLVLMVSDVPTWEKAAEELGLPSLTANGYLMGKLAITDLLAFREGLIVTGNRLVERGLADYRARRVALADLTEMPAADWAGRPGMKTKSERYDRGRIFTAAWIWSEFTGGRYDESPAWAAHPEFDAPATPMGSGRFYGNWLRRQSPARRDWLRSWGTRYLEERGCVSLPQGRLSG